MKFFFKSIVGGISIVYLFLVVGLSLAPWWPASLWWLANCFQVLPLWILLVGAGWLLFLSLLLGDGKGCFINFMSGVMIVFFVMGFHWPVTSKTLPKDLEKFSLKVMSINIGGRSDLKSLLNYIEQTNPEVIAFQETEGPTQEFLLQNLPSMGWEVVFKEQLGLASRFPILESNYRNRRMFGDWGAVVAYFALKVHQGIVYIFNVHLETPRDGIEALMSEKIAGIAEMKRVTAVQERESFLAAQWSKEFTPLAVVGDFNMPIQNPLLQQYWGHLRDAFSQQGKGFGFTKYTRWHGVRIDHVLVDKNWAVRTIDVGPDIKGDHRPVLAVLSFIGQLTQFPAAQKSEERPVSPQEALIYEDFENSFGRFVSEFKTELELYSNLRERAGKALKVQGRGVMQDLWAGVIFESWPLERYATVKFSYRIPAGLALGLRVQTQWEDWVCLGGTSEFVCPAQSVPNPYPLIADGAWHEATLNVRESVQRLLPGVKNLKSFQFFIPFNRYQGDEFLVDDFVITQ